MRRLTVVLSTAALAAGALASVAGQTAARAAGAPAYSATIGRPAVAAMYSSGFDYDPGHTGDSAHIVLADTGLDRIDFYTTQAGNGHYWPAVPSGHVGSIGAVVPAVGSTGVEFDTPRDLTVDPATGDIYVADTQNNRVQKLDKTGHFIWQAKQIAHPMGISYDAVNDQVDVAMTGSSLIVALSPATGAVLWKSPAPSTTGLKQPRDVIRGAGGRLWVDDYGHHEVKAFSIDGTGAGSWAPVGHLGTGTPGNANNQLSFPYNVAFSPDGNTAYVSDTGGHRIARWDISGSPSTWSALTPYGSQCSTFPAICPDPPADVGHWDDLRRVAVIPSTGQIIGDDFWGNGLQIWPPDGNVNNIVEIEGDSKHLTAADAGFAQVFGVTVGTNGSVYGVDRLNQRVERFDPSGTWLAAGGDRGIDVQTFSWPEAAAAAPDGTVWITDSQHDTLKDWAADLSSATAPLGRTDTGKNPGQFNVPEGVAVDAAGGAGGYHIWVADTLNSRIQVGDHNAANWQVFTQAGGKAFKHPRGVVVANGKVYIADSDNNRIVEMTTGGSFVAQYATGLKDPEGVALAADGSVWVANTQGTGAQHAMVHVAGDLSAALADSFGGFCAPCAPSDNTDFYRPHELAIAGGDLYVADTFDNRIQVYTLP